MQSTHTDDHTPVPHQRADHSAEAERCCPASYANRLDSLLKYPGTEKKIHHHARMLHRRQTIQDSIRPDLDDIKQDMRAKILEQEHKYDPVRCDPGGFVYTVLQNYIKTKQRYRNRKCRKEHFNSRSFDELRDSTHASPADPVAEQIEKQDLIEQCKKKLTDAQLQLLQLRTESSLRAIAGDLDVSYRKVRGMLAEIRETCDFIEESCEKTDHSIQDGIGH